MILVRHHNQGNLKPYFYFALEEYILTKLLKEGRNLFFHLGNSRCCNW